MRMGQRFQLVASVSHPVASGGERTARMIVRPSMTDAEIVRAARDFFLMAGMANRAQWQEYLAEESPCPSDDDVEDGNDGAEGWAA